MRDCFTRYLSSTQVISKHDREFHESLVQPAMFAHPSPKTVAIIGGGEGATLREVLRHKSVEKVTMIELDEKVVEVCKEFMPYLSNCTDIIGSAPSCFDDTRANVIIADAFKYFVDKQIKNEYDVLVIDGMDPEDHDEFTDVDVINALVNSLTPNGVMAVQIGIAPSILDPPADKGMNRKRELLINNLESAPGISSIHIYEEAHCGYWEPRAFLVACRDVKCRKHWYAETDEVDYQVYDRIGGTRSGERSLVHFDGATQRSFHAPPRAWETIYCLREPQPFECAYRGLDLDKELFEYFPENEEASAFELRATQTTTDDGEVEDGAAVYAKVYIPEGSFIMPTHLAASFEVSDDSMENISGEPTAEIEGLSRAAVVDDFIEYIDTYGHPSLQVGSGKNFVEIGGSFVIRISDDANEANVRRWIPTHPEGGRPKYSPVYDRHRHSFDVFLVASRDIKAGEEIVKPRTLWTV
jgi:spermidine synthase